MIGTRILQINLEIAEILEVNVSTCQGNSTWEIFQC